MSNILITGKPGVGKSTLVQAVLRRLTFRAGGFATIEIAAGRRRVGFEIRDLTTGQKGILAHVELRSPQRVGKYGVDVGAFERIGIPALEHALLSSELVVIDEIGKMELFSTSFQRVVQRVFGDPKPVLAVIQMRSTLFLDALRSRKDAKLFTVSTENRQRMVESVAKAVQDLDRISSRQREK